MPQNSKYNLVYTSHIPQLFTKTSCLPKQAAGWPLLRFWILVCTFKCFRIAEQSRWWGRVRGSALSLFLSLSLPVSTWLSLSLPGYPCLSLSLPVGVSSKHRTGPCLHGSSLLTFYNRSDPCCLLWLHERCIVLFYQHGHSQELVGYLLSLRLCLCLCVQCSVVYVKYCYEYVL